MNGETAKVLVAAADLAEGQATTDGAVKALLHYLAAYPAAYDVLYRALRATHVEPSELGSPFEVAEVIRWVTRRDASADAFARWSA
jgi:hypothetical protein